MWFNVDPRASSPIYQQLVDGIKEAVAAGILNPGDKMPTVRELAGQIAINPNTIAKAYQKLEQAGIIVSMRSRGTFITGNRTVVNLEEKQKLLQELISKVIVDAYHMGMEKEELEQIFHENLKKWEWNRGTILLSIIKH